MNTLYLERSTGECRKGDWVENFDLGEVGRIVVGIGPGSFAGIRSALAFAQGYALGKPGVEVLGLPSACAIAAAVGGKVAVIGDARQGKLWVARFDGFRMLEAVFQIEAETLVSGGLDAELEGFTVVSPDAGRIGGMLREKFGARYLGERLPTVDGLRAFAEAAPDALVAEPLPIYLNPAVRN